MAKLAAVGAGYWGKNIVRNLSQLEALHAICDADRDLLASMAEQYPGVWTTPSYEEILASPEIQGVCIAAPAAVHHELSLSALRAGKDVYVEKPLALTVEEGQEVVEAAQKADRVLMVGHILEYHPAICRLKEMVDRGELGQLRYIDSHRLNFGKIRQEENILWSFAPHDISVIALLLGELPAEVSAHGGNYLNHDVADVTVTCMRFGGGVRAHIYVSWLHPFKEQKLVVIGDEGMAVFDDQADHKLVVYPHRVEWKERQPTAVKAEGEPVPIDDTEPLRAEMSHFIKCVEEHKPPQTDGPSGLRVLRVLQACQRSLDRNGAAIPLAEIAPATKPYFAHETATVDEPCEIGAGTKIWHYSHVMKDCRIGSNCNLGQNVLVSPGVVVGDHVKIQNNVSLYTGVILEDYVFCGPSMVFTNVINPRSEIARKDEYRSTLVKRGATLGANSTIVCGHTVGRYAFVGAGAIVTRDVPDYALVVGVPARQIGWMCRCGVRLEVADGHAECTACSRRYEEKDGVLSSPENGS